MSLIKDDFLPSEAHNSLPYIIDNENVPHDNNQDITDLVSLFRKHQLPQGFCVKLVHKHFDTEGDEVMVSRDITVPTQGPGSDLHQYDDFFKELSSLVVERGLQKKLGLTIDDGEVHSRKWTEFEVPEKRGTIMIPQDVGGIEGLGLGTPLITEWSPISDNPLCVYCWGYGVSRETNDWFLSGKKMIVGSPLQLIVTLLLLFVADITCISQTPPSSNHPRCQGLARMIP
ncbi:hypothetical protein CI102_10341 [Trichoderma harzianum]|nr:hypothetical protein CI102_10341 [Trichoderma harzianum]